MNISAIAAMQDMVAETIMGIAEATSKDSPGGSKIVWRERIPLAVNTVLHAATTLDQWEEFVEEIKNLDAEGKRSLQERFSEKYFGITNKKYRRDDPAYAKAWEAFVESIWNSLLQIVETTNAAFSIIAYRPNRSQDD